MIESHHKEQEAAIAAALSASEPGDIVSIHAGDCGTVNLAGDETIEESDAACTCTPIEIVVGPKA